MPNASADSDGRSLATHRAQRCQIGSAATHPTAGYEYVTHGVSQAISETRA
jgi:hypothetical protein